MSEYRYTFRKFLKDWMLVIAMIAGAGIYLIYHSIPALHPAGPFLEGACKVIQPALLFTMLFLSFCKIEPAQMKPHIWQLWLLLIQGVTFAVLCCLLIWAARTDSVLAARICSLRIPLEAAILCMICPTATACAVVTGKLGGNMASVVSYTVAVNLMVAILVPLFFPLLYPMGGMSFAAAFLKILLKVFPLLIMPCICAWIIRYCFPKLHAWLVNYTGLSFYFWAAALTMAILMSTRGIVHSDAGVGLLAGIALASAICCIFQFWIGKRIGAHYGYRITAGQSMGQKNTVFAIWLGYTFLDPVSSVAGGFYSIWHNCFNTWQLRLRRKELEAGRINENVSE